jgi:hypothetical protein
MKQTFHEMTVDQLVERFTAIALDQDRALPRNDYARFNRLFDAMEVIKRELKGRDGDQTRITRALRSANAQVRLKAVKATLAVEPNAARRMLERIAVHASIRKRVTPE